MTSTWDHIAFNISLGKYFVIGYVLYRLVKWILFRFESSSSALPPFTGQRKIPTLVQFSNERKQRAASTSNKDGDDNDAKIQLIPCVNPATGAKLCDDLVAMTKQDVEYRVRTSREVQETSGWKYTSFAERRRVMKVLLRHILDHKHEIARASCEDTGKNLFEAHLGEVMLSCEKIRYMINHGEGDLASEHRRVPLMMMMKRATVQYHPLGLIAMIVPWNYPFHNIVGSMVTALFAGNAVCCKVSEYACYSLAHCFERVIHGALIEAGYSPDLVSFIIGYGDAGQSLVCAPGVDHVFFIGSPSVGRRVMSAASQRLTPVTLELGGKDAFIITDDTDVENAADYAVRSVFINCGQNCVAAERFYVHEHIYDEFVDRVVRMASELTIGPTTCPDEYESDDQVFEMGAMTMKGEVERIESLVRDAVNHGAIVKHGGSRDDRYPTGQFMRPTILTNVSQEMRIVQEETFGPVMLILKWKSDEEVIEKANGTVFGLGSYVFCRNYDRAHKIANQLVAGVSMVNDYGVFYLIQSMPFGGTKDSGFGKFGGREGLRAFSNQKSFVTDRFPIPSTVPSFMRYPTRAFSHLIVCEAVDLLYGSQLTSKLGNLVRLVSHILKTTKPAKKTGSTDEGKKSK